MRYFLKPSDMVAMIMGKKDGVHIFCYPVKRKICCFGTGVTSDPDRLYAGAFFREDVQFMCQRPSTLLALLQYLTLDFGPVQAKSLSQLTADTFVTDLDLVCPSEGYTGWYEQNGMTYYFRDGEALTGEQIIDGEICTFAPAGSQAQLTAGLTAEGGQVYTTTAYSLLEG